MKRILPAALLGLTLALTGACTESQSGGDSFQDNQDDQAPGQVADEPEGIETDD